MSRASQALIATAAIALALLAIAFWIAPSACEGGLEIYLQCGVVALAMLAALPFVLRTGNSLSVRFASALGLLILGATVWTVGLFAANVQILCRLF